MSDQYTIGEYSHIKQFVNFRADALRYISWTYICWLFIAIGICFGVYEIFRDSPLSSIRPSLWLYYLVVLVHVIFRLKAAGKAAILYPDMPFVVMYTMFHLGYVMFYDLGLVPYDTKVFVFEESIPKAMFIVNLGLISFLIGYEVFGSSKSNPKPTGNTTIPRYGWQIFGLLCIILALCMHLMVLAFVGKSLLQQYGYSGLQNIERYSGSFALAIIWSNCVRVMVLGVLVYAFASVFRSGKLFQHKIALGLTIFYLVLATLEGDRGPMLQVGAPLLLMRHYFIKQVKIRYLVLAGLICLIVFSGLGVVRKIVFDPSKMLEEYQYQKEAGVVTWMSPFLEMGHSFLIPNIVAHDVPVREPYWLGASWRDAVFHIIPFFQGFALRRGWATWGPSNWITVTYYGTERAGRSFTVASEGYLNFGYPGVFIELFVFGWAIRYLSVKFSRNPSAMLGIIMLGILGLLIKATRSHLNLVLSTCVHFFVIALFLNIFLGNEPEEVPDSLDEPQNNLTTYYG